MDLHDDKPTLLFVGGARAVSLSTDMAVRALRQAHDRGIRTHVTNPAEVLEHTPAVVAAADEVTAVGFVPFEQTVRLARELVAAGARVDAVFALQEMAQVAVAETAAAVGAAGNPPEVIRCIRTKDRCRATLAAAGFPQPTVRVCAGPGEAAAFLRESTGPWIVKPRDAMGSIGVSQIRSAADLPAAVDLLPGPGPFLVEEYVDGPEFSVEGVFLGGQPRILAITAKEKVAPPYFVEVGHALPADLPAERRAEIEDQVTAALTTLGMRAGGFHVELWLTDAGVVLGEVHGRFGGDWIHTMLAYAVEDLQLFGLVFDDLLARPVAARSLTPTRGAAVRYLTPPPGRLTAVHGWPELLTHPAVLYAELTVAPGDVIAPLRRSSDRVGVVVVGAESTAAAQSLARELADTVHFVTEAAEAVAAPRP